MVAAAIAAAFAAVATAVGGMVKGTAAKNMQVREEQAATVNYERQKTLGVYDLVKNEKQTLIIIIALGFGLLVFIYYMNTKKG